MRVLMTAADFANLSLLEPHVGLRRLLDNARVVTSDEMPHDVVTMNTLVVLRDQANGERREVRIVFPGDADPARGLVSVLEPLGLKLLGKAAGEVFDCLRVEQVVYQPEHSLRTNLVVRRPGG